MSKTHNYTEPAPTSEFQLRASLVAQRVHNPPAMHKDNVASGSKGLAFMGFTRRVWTFTVTALGANKNLGTAVYIDGDGDITWDSNDGSSPATAYTQLGTLWVAGKSGDTTITVALN